MRYTVVLEDEAEGGYSVSAALPGCHSQGDTRDEALANIREAIELYVETLREVGEPVPTEAGKDSSRWRPPDGGQAPDWLVRPQGACRTGACRVRLRPAERQSHDPPQRQRVGRRA